MKKDLARIIGNLGLGVILSSSLMCSHLKPREIKFLSRIRDLSNGNIYYTVNPDEIKIVKPIKKDIKKPYFWYLNPTWEKAIEYVQTPEEAQSYIGSLKKDNCVEFGIACAAVLSDNNYPPYLLVMLPSSSDEYGHAVFLYRTEKGFGALGSGDEMALDNGEMECRYKNIEELIRDYNHTYKYYNDKKKKEMEFNFFSYFILDLNKIYPDKRWMNKDFIPNTHYKIL